MLGISSKNYSLTPLQQETSAEISLAIPELPTALSDLISEMAVPGFQLATEAVELDEDGAVIENDRNKQILSCIESALTTPSSECDPSIKTTAFIQATVTSNFITSLRPYMVQIIQKIKEQGLRLNLDGATVSSLRLNNFDNSDFNGLSARGTSFERLEINYLRFEGADFTGAKFVDTSMNWVCLDRAIITDATFSGVSFLYTSASELAGNQSGITEVSHIQPRQEWFEGRIITINSTILLGDHVSAGPDQNPFTLPANKRTPPSTGRS